MTKRIESLDYLRGLMALAVMVYHYTSWTLGTVGVEHLLGKLGIYAVAIFYILSGVSLTLVYQDRIQQARDVYSFAVKRVFRILPLFWLSVVAALGFRFVEAWRAGAAFAVPWPQVFLNLTLLFGFVQPTAYLSTGAWSIGNEWSTMRSCPSCSWPPGAFPEWSQPLSCSASRSGESMPLFCSKRRCL